MTASEPTWTNDFLHESRFVHALARALVRDAGLAHDVAQETLLESMRERGPVRNPRGWLAAIARRLAASMERRERERSEHERRAARPEAADGGFGAAERLRLHRRLCDAVLALPEPYRTVVTLRWTDDASPRQIARRLQRSPDLVRQQLSRGLAMLRQRLDREFRDRGGWVGAFAACGLGGGAGAGAGAAGVGVLASWLAEAFVMKKVVAAAVVVVLGVGAVWWSQRAQPMVAPPAGGGGGVAAAAGGAPVRGREPEVAAAVARDAAQEADEPSRARQALEFAVGVVDEERRPVAGATVRCWPAAGGTFVERTGDDGRAAFAPGNGADSSGGAVRVEVDGRPPVLHVVDALLGEHRVVLERGAELAGRVFVDGAPAPADFQLRLSVPRAPLPPGLPEQAVQWLEDPLRTALCRSATDAAGRFAFAGLPPGFRGSLVVPTTHWVVPQPGQEGAVAAESPCALRIDAPQRDLPVVTTQLPTVQGRVIWDDTHEPVPRAFVDVVGDFEGSNDDGAFVRTDESGWFAVGLEIGGGAQHERWLDPARREVLMRCQIAASAPGSERVQIELPIAGATTRVHEIVVRLPRATVQHFVARDEDGAGIAGARVATAAGASEPAGPDGCGTFRGEPVGVVGAPGFLTQSLHGPWGGKGTAADPFAFVLQRGNELRIRVRTPDRVVPPTFWLVLAVEGCVFANGPGQSVLDRMAGDPAVGGSARPIVLPDGTRGYRSSTADLRVPADGVVVLHSLRPGARCTVRLASGSELASRQIVLPMPGETTEVELVVAALPRVLRGRVCDAGGVPLAATIGVGGPGNAARARVDGTFEIVGCYKDGPLRLVASHRGYATQAIDGLTRDRDGELLEFRLARGRTVRVTVRDGTDRIVPVRIGKADDMPDTGAPQELAPGVWEFHDLPPGTVTFGCRFPCRVVEVQHDTANPEAVLRVPDPVRVTIAAPPDWPKPATGRLAVLVRLVGAESQPFETTLDDEELFLPGRYRFELVARTWSGNAEVRTPQGPAAEVTLRSSGEPQRIELR